MKIILIDDERDFAPHVVPESAELIVVRNSSDALNLLNSCDHVDQLWLDHDLGWDEFDNVTETIAPVWRWLEEERRPIDHIFVHTSNPYAGDQMEATLRRMYRVSRVATVREHLRLFSTLS